MLSVDHGAHVSASVLAVLQTVPESKSGKSETWDQPTWVSVEQIASIYNFCWHIEKFFASWERHFIARSEYGLMVPVLIGLITHLRLAIYCHEQYQGEVTIRRVRLLRIEIQNELRDSELWNPCAGDFKEQHGRDGSPRT